LPEILLLLLRAILAGADDVTKVAFQGGQNSGLLPCRHGIASHDTPGEVIRRTRSRAVRGLPPSRVEGLREAGPDSVAVDGETSRRGHDRGKGR